MNENQMIVADSYLNPTRWEQMEKLATSLVQSRAFPKSIQNAPQALVVMQAGIEMGMKPLEAINSLSIINGVIGTWGKATVKRVRDHGWKIEYQMLSERGGGCKATVTKDDESYTDTLYFEQAEKSGWTHYQGKLKPGWMLGANREMKLRYGVLSKIIKTYIPEVLGSAQEIVEVAEDYVIEEVKPEPTNKTTVITTTPDERKDSLADFIKKEKESKKNDTKNAQKVSKTAKTTSNSPKSVESLDKPQVEEGEIVTEAAKEPKA